MTIQEVLDIVDGQKPNMMTEAQKIRAISDIEGMIHSDIIMKHVHTQEEETCPVYTSETDRQTVLLAPERFCYLYVYWVETRIDDMNQEMDKFNNDYAKFDNLYGSLADFWTQTHMPITAKTHFEL